MKSWDVRKRDKIRINIFFSSKQAKTENRKTGNNSLLTCMILCASVWIEIKRDTLTIVTDSDFETVM